MLFLNYQNFVIGFSIQISKKIVYYKYKSKGGCDLC